MRVSDTAFEGLKVINPKVHGDDRGYFMETYSQKDFFEAGIHHRWVQDNEAKSGRGVLRGLHYQRGEAAQTKLVRVVMGKVLDVVVDIRPDSLTYGKYFDIVLSDENKTQLLVPKGFAHGYLVLSDVAVFQYKVDAYYHPQKEGGIRYDDPGLRIDWGMPATQLILSQKDKNLPFFGRHLPL